MADRYRSRDGVQETRQFIDDANTPAQQGRSGGNLERKVGTRDLLKRAEQGQGATRVTKSDEKGNGGLGGLHGTGKETSK